MRDPGLAAWHANVLPKKLGGHDVTEGPGMRPRSTRCTESPGGCCERNSSNVARRMISTPKSRSRPDFAPSHFLIQARATAADSESTCCPRRRSTSRSCHSVRKSSGSSRYSRRREDHLGSASCRAPIAACWPGLAATAGDHAESAEIDWPNRRPVGRCRRSSRHRPGPVGSGRSTQRARPGCRRRGFKTRLGIVDGKQHAKRGVQAKLPRGRSRASRPMDA